MIVGTVELCSLYQVKLYSVVDAGSIKLVSNKKYKKLCFKLLVSTALLPWLTSSYNLYPSLPSCFSLHTVMDIAEQY